MYIFAQNLLGRERKSFPFLIGFCQFPMKNLEKKILQLTEEFLVQESMEDCFVLEVRLEKSKHLKVFIDSDEAVTFRKCSRISRHLEEHIEEKQWLPSNYKIEVSSPGAEKPLVNIRQYSKHIGRTLILETKIESLEGTLLSVEEDSLIIEQLVDKKKKIFEKINVAFKEIVKANIKIMINSKKK